MVYLFTSGTDQLVQEELAEAHNPPSTNPKRGAAMQRPATPVNDAPKLTEASAKRHHLANVTFEVRMHIDGNYLHNAEVTYRTENRVQQSSSQQGHTAHHEHDQEAYTAPPATKTVHFDEQQDERKKASVPTPSPTPTPGNNAYTRHLNET
jgi:hypothetical protein